MGRDKRLLKIGDRTFLQNSVDLLSGFVENIFIIGQKSSEFTDITIPDIHPGLGPLGGIYTALKEINAEHYLIIPVDLPNLSKKILSILLDSVSPKYQIVVMRSANGVEPLVGVYSKSILELVENNIALGKRSVHHLFNEVKTRFVDIDVNQVGTESFFNVNYRSDYLKFINRKKEVDGGKMGKYIEVTDASFDQEVLQSDLPVLVDFWAVWCAPCRLIAPIVEELAGEKEGKLKVAKMDVDNNPNVAAKFGIRSIPTLLVFKGGQVVDQIVGAVPKAMIESKLEKHLA